MIDSYDFLKGVLDTISDHIVVIDNYGDILFVNNTWKSFGQQNECQINDDWHGVNYLNVCDKAAHMGDDFGTNAAAGIRAVIRGEKTLFYFEYPCHSPDENRWFMMRVTPFISDSIDCFVISHSNITERKLAEQEVLKLSRLDGLTDIPNRRYFDEFLANEWKRCQRLGLPISLALIDLDYFKLLNDTYGHQAGDAALKAVGTALKGLSGRPGDIHARYGGEEFAVVYAAVSLDNASILTRKLLDEIRSLNIPNEASPKLPTLTASIGLATMQPSGNNSAAELIKEADRLLYAAKANGKNQIQIS